MSKTYTDYINKTALTIPEKFIDVRTGNSHEVSPKIQEQIDYHSKNNTLMHLVFSALNNYLHPKMIKGNRGTDELLVEILAIKSLVEQGYVPQTNVQITSPMNDLKTVSQDLDMKEVEDVLEFFGG